jgi:hypothetical protein
MDWLRREEYSVIRQGSSEDFSRRIFIGIHGIPDITTIEGRSQILHQTTELLNRMPVWDVAQKFRRLLLKLLAPEAGGLQAL